MAARITPSLPGTSSELANTLKEALGSSPLDELPIEMDADAIALLNPHRFEMALLSDVRLLRPQSGLIVGSRLLDLEEFWVAGNSPGTNTLPSVLMIEIAGQLCSLYWQKLNPSDKRTFALGEIKRARFYADVAAGNRLVVVAKTVDMNRRKAEFDTAGFVDGKCVFEATIVGMALTRTAKEASARLD